MAEEQFMGQGPFGTRYFLNASLAGGLCCSVTHGGVVPVDVVKTRIQLDPVTFNTGLLGGARKIIASEGVKGLLTGLGPTAQGYFIQGWFKFGGVEFFKILFGKKLGEKGAWDNRNNIYLAAAACAEFTADIFLCPFEACRIRLVSDPTYASGMGGCAKRLMSEMGFMGGFYSGFVPILFKQIPYTMAKFGVQGKAAEMIYRGLGKGPTDMTDGAGGDGTMFKRLGNIAKEEGFLRLCTVGLPARWVMIGTLTAGQFGIFDAFMTLVGAQKFHFVNPDAPH